MRALILATSTCFLAACQGETKTEEQTSNETKVQAPAPVMLTDVGAAEEFPEAALSMGNVTATPEGDSVRLSFNFNVKNYELKNQTSDENSQLCNNSAQGQHIHFILDNRPYVALYEPKHETVVEKNSEHYMLAFLSRSYHLSIKNKGAAVLYHFKVDEQGRLQKLAEPKTPMVFYSRPKGDYLGKDTENVLLDFYLWNATLGGGHHLRADITTGGRDTSLMLTEWKPYFLNNLQMGKSTIKLTLLDSAGKRIEGPQTQVSRDINLSKDEPMQ